MIYLKGKENYTYFERIRVIAARALQISQGAPVLVKTPKGLISPVEIAKLEWNSEVIPIDTKKRGIF